jgi:hypothetical protein
MEITKLVLDALPISILLNLVATITIVAVILLAPEDL